MHNVQFDSKLSDEVAKFMYLGMTVPAQNIYDNSKSSSISGMYAVISECYIFIIHVHLSPPSETLFCQHVMGYSVMAEKSVVFINGSLLLHLCLWTRICIQHSL